MEAVYEAFLFYLAHDAIVNDIVDDDRIPNNLESGICNFKSSIVHRERDEGQRH
jgi:hypothetical protein